MGQSNRNHHARESISNKGESMKSILDVETVSMKGELAVRQLLNYSRLEGKWYRPDEVFEADQHGWPADWEGRCILALSLHAKMTGRFPAYLDEIVDRIGDYTNEKGYFGKICENGYANEQQLAGHSWLVRGLLEYHKLTGKANAIKHIEDVMTNLLLPTTDNFKTYPLTVEEISRPTGWELSHPQSKTKSHAKSIDTGCGFIMLDGATALLEFYKTDELKELCEIMVDRFGKVQLQECNVQTHATLSAVRGALRYYECTGEKHALDIAIRIFDDYKREAWTEHYGNFNWWGKPRWTEPCGIIDSYIIAAWLWRLTDNAQYIEDAHHIFYNAGISSQRVNGAFGNDYCLGADLLKYEPWNDGNIDMRFVIPRTYEIYWCCTMRAGELFEKAFATIFAAENNTVHLAFYHNCEATLSLQSGNIKIKETTGYPYEGNIQLEILESNISEPIDFKIHVPDLWRTNDAAVVKINDKPVEILVEEGCFSIPIIPEVGATLSVEFGIKFHVMKVQNPKENIHGNHSFRHGPMMLAVDCDLENIDQEKHSHAPVSLPENTEFEYIGKGSWKLKDGSVILSPLCRIDRIPTIKTARQALFDESEVQND